MLSNEEGRVSKISREIDGVEYDIRSVILSVMAGVETDFANKALVVSNDTPSRFHISFVYYSNNTTQEGICYEKSNE